MIQPERLQRLNERPVRAGSHVLYWMQAAQRAQCNHALEYAVREANRLGQPLLVVFGLSADFPEANERHYRFLLEGLAETQQGLRARGLKLVVLPETPPQAALTAGRGASLIVTDRGYLRIQRQWREQVAIQAESAVIEVETEAIVPVQTASPKEEVGARTLRPKLQRLWESFLHPLTPTAPHHPSLHLPLEGLDLSDLPMLLHRLKVPRSPSTSRFTGGATEGLRRLERFLDQDLRAYETRRNDPLADAVSHLSPYLHFGQLSPLPLALAVRERTEDSVPVFLEQLLVRRELALNFVYYNRGYDDYEQAVPHWARQALFDHARDPRPLYSLAQLESAATDDPYWNAAMREMVLTGYLHNALRMYWGKQIIGWSASPPEAYARLAYLNNKYFVDGRDPVSWASLAWCFGKHDRPWPSRPIFGTVRYMNANGLRRKFDVEGYVAKVAELT